MNEPSDGVPSRRTDSVGLTLPTISTSSSTTTGPAIMNDFEPTAETLPAASVPRYSSVCSPAAVTTTGVVYAVHAPPSRRYSSATVPGDSSVPVSVTVTGPVPVTAASTVGGVVSTV